MNLEYGPTGSNPTGSNGPQFTLDFQNITSSVTTTVNLPNINETIALQVGRVNATAKAQVKQAETIKVTLNGPANYTIALSNTNVNLGNSNFSSSLDFDNKNSTFLTLDRLNNAADGLVMDIPSNMPFGNSGIKYVDFIRSIQKKFNLIIYADKRNNNQFVIETFNDWYNKGRVINFDEYVQTEEQIQVIPANTLAFQKLTFKDKSEVDYYGSLFKTQSNREFGQEYFDTTNQFSQGEFRVETQFGSSPLVLPADTLQSGSSQALEVPAFVADAQYKPATVFPRIFFYNGQKNVDGYYIFLTPNTSLSYNVAPHFGHYNNSIPTTGSRSLLFLNETPNFGTTPTQSLYTKYWETYISLLYNPKTKMVNAKAVIPLAEYFDIELNDVAFFRGNHYHIRAINNYSMTTGECDLVLLGPVLPDTIAGAQYNVYPNPGEDSNYSQVILRPFYQAT